mmetsp:Transcript_26100/g.76542  ORF Transcript_26100/g.76542 Transcript_26100/m.76542 type:complete len:295 (+) Transcript_26100:473-1357(+)
MRQVHHRGHLPLPGPAQLLGRGGPLRDNRRCARAQDRRPSHFARERERALERVSWNEHSLAAYGLVLAEPPAFQLAHGTTRASRREHSCAANKAASGRGLRSTTDLPRERRGGANRRVALRVGLRKRCFLQVPRRARHPTPRCRAHSALGPVRGHTRRDQGEDGEDRALEARCCGSLGRIREYARHLRERGEGGRGEGPEGGRARHARDTARTHEKAVANLRKGQLKLERHAQRAEERADKTHVDTKAKVGRERAEAKEKAEEAYAAKKAAEAEAEAKRVPSLQAGVDFLSAQV